MMQCLTFACEKCGEVHTSGEAPFMLNKLECSELGEDAGAECLENRIYAEQDKLIRKRYGKRVADLANNGWGVTGTDEYIDIATKVYGRPAMILSSKGVYATGEITHSWEEY